MEAYEQEGNRDTRCGRQRGEDRQGRRKDERTGLEIEIEEKVKQKYNKKQKGRRTTNTKKKERE